MTDDTKQEHINPGPAQLWMPPAGKFPIGPLTTDGALAIDRIDGDSAVFLPTEEAMAGMTVLVSVLQDETNGWQYVGPAQATAEIGETQ